jgi:hypothetical protein
MARESPNGRCCVFQPFDNKGDFDKRFDDVLTPAIVSAGMEPYRVDRDLGSIIPVDTLHQEIRSAVICVADITTRNPNVMYELGFAIAADKDVIIISGPTQEKFPFDIQHRGILSYATGSISDFRQLEEALTGKLKATLARQEKTIDIAAASPVKSSDGLQPHELTALALVLADSNSLEDTVSANWLKQEMRKAGYTETGTRLALARLVKLGYIRSEWKQEYEERFVVYGLTQEGEDWLLANQTLLQIQAAAAKPKKVAYADEPIKDEDIPF